MIGCRLSRALIWIVAAGAAQAVLPFGADPSRAADRCDAVLRAGQHPSARFDRAPAGARVCFAAGRYRLHRPLRPRAGQTLVADGHATLLGSVPLRFRRSGSVWWAPAPTDEGTVSGFCKPRVHGACRYPQAVFRDGRPLRRAINEPGLGRGSFWLDRARNRIVIAADPHGHRLEIAVTPAAIVARHPGIDVDGLRIARFATPAQHGAIDLIAGGSTIRDTTVTLNHGAGVTSERSVAILGSRMVRNGQEGIGGTGSRIRIERNVISDNGWAGFDPAWEAGGAKWAVADHLRVAHNTVEGNSGPGLWTDIDSDHVAYADNLVVGNSRAGIFHEIGGRASITGNEVRRNGFGMATWLWGSGILIAASHGVEVSRNEVARNANGIGLVQQDRGLDPRGHPHLLHDIRISHNVVALGSGDTGMVEDDGDVSVFADPTITFVADAYRDSAGRRFMWNDRELTAAQWRAAGNDVDGTFRALR